MLVFIIRRILLSLLTIFAVSIISFGIIQLPPGDYVSSYVARLLQQGEDISETEADNLRIQYGLDKPFPVQYYKWASRAVRGNYGMSMEYQRPVGEVIGDRL